MTTMFKLVCDACGLSLREAARFLDVKPDTAKSWSSGRNPVPDSAIDELIHLNVRIDVAAREELLRIEGLQAAGLPEKIEIGIAVDDAHARSLGWPCAGAHHAVIRNAIELAPEDIKCRIVIVPRRSTAAADPHTH